MRARLRELAEESSALTLGPPSAAAPSSPAPPLARRPGGRSPSTSFLKDCSFTSSEAGTPGCRRLRELFQGKEVLGQEIECKEKHPYEDPHPYVRRKRQEYIHDSSTDLWYKCCEHRPRWGEFSIEAEHPRFPPEVSAGQLSGMALNALGSSVGQSFGARLPGIPDDYEEPIGPLLQCKVYQNLKHREKLTPTGKGDRVIVDLISSGAFGNITGLSGTKCAGDEAVALQDFSGGLETRMLITDDGECVDIGPPGAATPEGKKYHVFRLSAPDPSQVAALRAACAHVGGGARRRGQRHDRRAGAFL